MRMRQPPRVSTPTKTTPTAAAPARPTPKPASPRSTTPNPASKAPPSAGAARPASPGARPAGGAPAVSSSSQKQSLKDRALALFITYEPQKVPQIETLTSRMAGDEKRFADFLSEYSKRHGPEPPSKMHALQDFFQKHYKNDKSAIDSAMSLIKSSPGIEVAIFSELMASQQSGGAKAPPGAPGKTPVGKGTSPPPPAGGGGAKGAVSPGPGVRGKTPIGAPAGGAAGGPGARPGSPQRLGGPPGSPATGAMPPGGKAPMKTMTGAKQLPAGPSSPPRGSGGPGGAANAHSPRSPSALDISAITGVEPADGMVEHATQTQLRERSSCEREVRDRIIAMLAAYDPDSLLVFDEDADIPTTDVGNSFLNSLMEQHGPEPASKRDAIETLLRRLLEKQDPHRLRSLKTLVSAAESSGKECQIVKAMFSAYGLSHRVGKAVPSQGLAPAVSQGALLDFSSGGMTSSTILSPWSANVAASPWSPEASLHQQRSLFASSPRRMPLTSTDDLKRQMNNVPHVKRLASTERAPSFSDMLVMDTAFGEQALPGASDALQTELERMDVNPFAKTKRGEVVTVSASDGDSGATSRDDSNNPFLRSGASPRPLGLNTSVPTPKTPPQIDLSLVRF